MFEHKNEIVRFLLVVEHGNILTAAQILGLTQPALSYTIATLEKRLGAELFERLQYGVRLTPFGREAAERARAVLLEMERGEEHLAARAAGRTGRLRVTAGPAFPEEGPEVDPSLGDTDGPPDGGEGAEQKKAEGASVGPVYLKVPARDREAIQAVRKVPGVEYDTARRQFWIDAEHRNATALRDYFGEAIPRPLQREGVDYLWVPAAERNKAVAAGARFDRSAGLFYVPEDVDPGRFDAWRGPDAEAAVHADRRAAAENRGKADPFPVRENTGKPSPETGPDVGAEPQTPAEPGAPPSPSVAGETSRQTSEVVPGLPAPLPEEQLKREASLEERDRIAAAPEPEALAARQDGDVGDTFYWKHENGGFRQLEGVDRNCPPPRSTEVAADEVAVFVCRAGEGYSTLHGEGKAVDAFRAWEAREAPARPALERAERESAPREAPAASYALAPAADDGAELTKRQAAYMTHEHRRAGRELPDLTTEDGVKDAWRFVRETAASRRAAREARQAAGKGRQEQADAPKAAAAGSPATPKPAAAKPDPEVAAGLTPEDLATARAHKFTDHPYQGFKRIEGLGEPLAEDPAKLRVQHKDAAMQVGWSLGDARDQREAVFKEDGRQAAVLWKQRISEIEAQAKRLGIDLAPQRESGRERGSGRG